MKKHTENFKENIKKMGRELDSKISYILNGEEIELGNSDLNSITPVFEGDILKSIMKELDIDSNIDIPVGTEINYKFGVSFNGSPYEYIDFGNYIVYSSEKQEDTNSYNIVCYDKMLNSMIEYKKLQTEKDFPMPVRDYINCICTDLNLEFADKDKEFANWNQMIPIDLYEELGYTYRDVLDELAQVTASNIVINENNEVEIRYVNDTKDIINESYLKDVNVSFGEKYGPVNSIVLSRSAEADNVYIQNETSVKENGLCEIKIADNQIMNFNNRSDYLPAILGKLDGLEFYTNDFASTGICYYEPCDRYNVQIDDNIYSCVMFNDQINITQGIEEFIHTDLPEVAQTDYTKADKTDRRINQTYLIVDKQNQTIEGVVSQVDEHNERLTQIQQSIDEIKSIIKDFADLTISADSINAKLELNNIFGGEPLNIKIHPISEDIYITHPNNYIYPSNNTFSRIRSYLKFENTKTGDIFEYDLPQLIYLNQDLYDEFEIDYETKRCFITKKLQYVDGNINVLDKEEIIELEYPIINLTPGDYIISVLDYTNVYIYAKLVLKNQYTDLFATKTELRSSITQTEDKIESEVSKVESLFDEEIRNTNSRITQTADSINASVNERFIDVNGEIKEIKGDVSLKIDKGDTNEIVSALNIAVNQLIINADNFKLTKNGEITASAGDIGGWILTPDGLTNGTIFIRNDGYSTIYTASDIFILKAILQREAWVGNIDIGTPEFKRFDLNNDGVINSADLLILRQMLNMV